MSLAKVPRMSMQSSVTHFHASRVQPCLCDPNEEWPHGFRIEDGRREGMYLAARQNSGDVRWLDLAISVGAGTVALRVWVDVESRMLRSRALSKGDVDGHPAVALGGWLNKVEVAALGIDLDLLATQVVLGDDRLSAHLWDLPHAATEVAMPARSMPARAAAPTRKVLARTMLGLARR
ncbi:MAG: hypothetical protein JST00_20265 [Deltaproteobacteria bacterium]|nr:hypothetical protein [Deltaproteobacteria bacterium]